MNVSQFPRTTLNQTSLGRAKARTQRPAGRTGTSTPDPARQPCRHDRREVGPVDVELCYESSFLEWFDGNERLDPDVGMARVFGHFNLVATLPALGAPGPMALVYGPPTSRERNWMRALPQNEWLHALDGVWISHNGDQLLLSPLDQIMVENLSRNLSPSPD